MTAVAPAAAGQQVGLVSAEELLDMPDDGLRRELVDGVVRTSPPRGATHGRIAADLLWYVADHVEDNALGAVFTAGTGFRISRDPDTVRAPDVAFVRADRVAEADVDGVEHRAEATWPDGEVPDPDGVPSVPLRFDPLLPAPTS